MLRTVKNTLQTVKILQPDTRLPVINLFRNFSFLNRVISASSNNVLPRHNISFQEKYHNTFTVFLATSVKSNIIPHKTLSTLKPNGTADKTELLSSSNTRDQVSINPVDVQKRLMAFFEDEKNWKEEKVKSGRSWSMEDLRIKSNTDLHKLWYVLLKEKNMLLTMQHAAKEENELMASPERLDKVEESMENLENVVRERNRAYHQLETGESGERQVKIVKDGLGLYRRYAEMEHAVPAWMNTSFWKRHYFNGRGNAVRRFIALYREKNYDKKIRAMKKQRGHVRGLLKRFPDLDEDFLQEKFPDVNIKKLKYSMS